MNQPKFPPWIGSRYKDSEQQLLLVGESFYGEPDDDPTQSTLSVVDNWRSGKWKLRYLTAAARVLTGKQSWDINRVSDLNDIAFYNFVQVGMPFCGKRPSAEEGRASQNAFKEVLELLSPTHVVATGVFVWEHLPQFDGRESRFQVGNSFHEIGEYYTSRGTVLATTIPHLSRFFSPPRWRPVVQTFLSLKELPSE